LGLDLSLERGTDTSTTLELGLNASADAGKLGLKANDDTSGQVSISIDTSRALGAGRGAGGGTSGRLASQRAEEAADHTLTRSGSRLLAHKAAEKTGTSRTTGLAEAESTALELLRLLHGSCSGGGDKSRNSESVVDHVVEIRN
jgi:hypothetical protein